MVKFYQEHCDYSPEAAVDEHCNSASLERRLNCEPDQVTWYDLETIARVDPALVAQRWEELSQAVRNGLQRGQGQRRGLGDGGVNAGGDEMAIVLPELDRYAAQEDEVLGIFSEKALDLAQSTNKTHSSQATAVGYRWP